MGAVVGIDLGTTNTVVATVVDGIALTLEDPHGRRLLPSVVSFHPSGNVLVGELARERRVVDAANTVHSAKRLIGRPWSSPEVVEARARLPYVLVEGQSASTMVQSRGKTYALAEISAFVLRTVKKMAEETLGERVEGATITVPASFNEAQRSATINQEAEVGRVNQIYDIELARLKKLWAAAAPGSLGPMPNPASPSTPAKAATSPAASASAAR